MNKPDISWFVNQFFLLDGIEEQTRESKKRAYGAINARGMSHQGSRIQEYTYNFHQDEVRTTPKFPSF
jgi:hypothetical protein